MYKQYAVIVLLMIIGLFSTLYSVTLSFLIIGVVILISLLFLNEANQKKQMLSDLERLSDSIVATLNHNDEPSVLHIEDSLVSKIAHQNNQLIKRLDYYHDKEKNERQKLEQLIGDISHQLKTPFANVKMYQDLLLDCDEKDKVELSKSLFKQTEKMEWLIESLMLLSRIESGCLNIQISENDLNQTILEAVNMVYPKAINRQITIEYHPKECIVAHDSKWTSEAIFNVLDNAVKYSEAGASIYVTLTSSDMFETITITDEGIGINESEMNQIFKRFYKGQDTHDYEGVGIGLYLSQEIMMKQGGYIYCKGIKNGTSFLINIKK